MSWHLASRAVSNGRHTQWMVIDGTTESLFATLDDEHEARALVAVLNGADAVYRAEINRLDGNRLDERDRF